ncbi:MAG: hypothetical protein MJ198_08825 [Bacteroidales bacterium]|nr:hypothetical protein [Bacteroidales bacterium]
MGELEEYQKCLDEIEFYRSKREELEQEITILKQQIVDIERSINEKYQQDEIYGAKMHELAIKRNLLEP